MVGKSICTWLKQQAFAQLLFSRRTWLPVWQMRYKEHVTVCCNKTLNISVIMIMRFATSRCVVWFFVISLSKKGAVYCVVLIYHPTHFQIMLTLQFVVFMSCYIACWLSSGTNCAICSGRVWDFIIVQLITIEDTHFNASLSGSCTYSSISRIILWSVCGWVYTSWLSGISRSVLPNRNQKPYWGFSQYLPAFTDFWRRYTSNQTVPHVYSIRRQHNAHVVSIQVEGPHSHISFHLKQLKYWPYYSRSLDNMFLNQWM